MFIGDQVLFSVPYLLNLNSLILLSNLKSYDQKSEGQLVWKWTLGTWYDVNRE
jgi:hypothetical protein